MDLSGKLCRRTSFTLCFAETLIFLDFFFVLWLSLGYSILLPASGVLPISLGVVGWSGADQLWSAVPVASEVRKSWFQWDYTLWTQWAMSLYDTVQEQVIRCIKSNKLYGLIFHYLPYYRSCTGAIIIRRHFWESTNACIVFAQYFAHWMRLLV